MAVEIERKFLVKSDRWRPASVQIDHLRDGLVARFGGGKVRVRIAGNKACITIKGPRTGISRPEFEYEIPLSDGEEMLTICTGPVVEKTRHSVPYGGLMWTIDVYHGLLAGIEIAEVELRREDDAFAVPPWAGAEVTHETAYRQEALIRSRLASKR